MGSLPVGSLFLSLKYSARTLEVAGEDSLCPSSEPSSALNARINTTKKTRHIPKVLELQSVRGIRYGSSYSVERYRTRWGIATEDQGRCSGARLRGGAILPAGLEFSCFGYPVLSVWSFGYGNVYVLVTRARVFNRRWGGRACCAPGAVIDSLGD
jgi:hypothetical protein